MPSPAPTPSPRPPLIIGIAGGIGSGKSAVARAFGRLGCAVIDSDAEAKTALDRPEVRQTLASWWGPGVLMRDAAGSERTDRSAVGRIVFADPAARARLEALIHPLIRRTRETARREAVAAGAKAIIYDAPLLFEAGIDKLCDAVVWVECPREERLRRVRVSRGWDEAELAKREAAQWPLKRKRALCSHEIWNGAGPKAEEHDFEQKTAQSRGTAPSAEVDQQAHQVLAILLDEAPAGGPG
ncbi:MAG: dephospho-CoA kinase [Phycisphaerales bacterium]